MQVKFKLIFFLVGIVDIHVIQFQGVCWRCQQFQSQDSEGLGLA